MGILRPLVPVDKHRTIELYEGSQATWTYTLPHGQTFPAGSTAVLIFKNTFKQELGTWDGVVDGGTVIFDESPEVADLIPRAATWTLLVKYEDTTPRVVASGTVVRAEHMYPNAPANSGVFDAVQYRYAFTTPGRLVDPAWRVLAGIPRVYDNSEDQLPNAVAAGSILTGELYPEVAMLYYAPLNSDAIKLSYNTVRNQDGQALVVICSNYDMTNYAAIWHKQSTGSDDTIAIVTGSGPTTFSVRDTGEWQTESLQNYTAEYNPVTNTFAVHLDGETILEWEDQNDLVYHGPGDRYFGLGFKSELLSPGVMISEIFIQDAI